MSRFENHSLSLVLSYAPLSDRYLGNVHLDIVFVHKVEFRGPIRRRPWRRTAGSRARPNCSSVISAGKTISCGTWGWSGDGLAVRSQSKSPSLVVERYGRADEILEGRFIDFVVFMNVNGAPDGPVLVEEACWIFERGALGEGKLHMGLV